MIKHLAKRAMLLAGSAVAVAGILLSTCTKNNPVTAHPVTLTLDVQDGVTGAKLTGALVTYVNTDGKTVLDTTDKYGRLCIIDLAAGTQSIQISNTSKYTERTLLLGAHTESTDASAMFFDTAAVINLYPRSGSINGTIATQLNSKSPRIAAKGVTVSFLYDSCADMLSSTSQIDTVSTDSLGNFILDSLPVVPSALGRARIQFAATNVVLKKIPIKIVKTDTTFDTVFVAYQPDTAAITMPVIVAGKAVPMGVIVYSPTNASAFKLANEILPQYGPFDTISLLFSDTLDTATTTAYFSDTANLSTKLPATVIVNGTTLKIVPMAALLKSHTYSVTVSACGIRGGTVDYTSTFVSTSLTNNKTNMVDAFGNPRRDFGLYDTMWVAFQENLDTSVNSVIWGTPAAVTHVVNNTNAVIWISGDTLFMKPDVGQGWTYNDTFGFNAIVKTASGRIVSTGDLTASVNNNRLTLKAINNRDSAAVTGQEPPLRPFTVTGDSLQIKFSEPINTDPTAAVPFRVSGISSQYTVTWNTDKTLATIKTSDTLTMADYDGSSQIAAASVKFDFTTVSGFEFHGFNGATTIPIATENGLTVLGTNLLGAHNNILAVTPAETPTDTFHVDDSITLTFNRAIDTALIKSYDLANQNPFVYLLQDGNTQKIPVVLKFPNGGTSITIKPVDTLTGGQTYNVYLSGVPGKGIRFAGANSGSASMGSYTGKAAGNALLSTSFTVVSNVAVITKMKTGKIANTLGGSTAAMGVTGYTYMTANQLTFRIRESAWNAKHADSVSGYQVQLQRMTKDGTLSGWYDAGNVPTQTWSIFSPATDTLNYENLTVTSDLVALLATPSHGGGYNNGADLFNDSSVIQLRVRPYVADADPAKGRVGAWSTVISYADKVAPCDQSYSLSLTSAANGGVSVSKSFNLNNSFGVIPDSSGTITMTFPEDMDITAGAPSVEFFYGSFDSSRTPLALPTKKITTFGGHWTNARTYQLSVAVPVYDYTDSKNVFTYSGAYWNVNVAGCKDMSGVTIAAYGDVGPDASSALPTNSMTPADLSVAQGSITAGSSCIFSSFSQ